MTEENKDEQHQSSAVDIINAEATEDASRGVQHSTEAGTVNYDEAHASAKSLGRTMVFRFSLLSMATIAVFGVVFGYFVNNMVQNVMVKSYAETVTNNVTKIITPFLEERDTGTPAIVNKESDFCNPEKNPGVDCSEKQYEHYLMRDDGRSDHYDQLQEFLDENVLTKDIAKVKLWGVKGEVLYHSQEPELIGQLRNLESPALADLRTAMDGKIAAALTGATSAEGGGEKELGELIEVYAPYYLDDGNQEVDGVFEAYYTLAPLQAQLAAARKTLFAALAFLFIALLGVVQIASGIMQRQNGRLQELSKKLEMKADTDGLTGIHNHRHFQSYMETEVDRAIRYKRPVSLLLVDLDFFKSVNDTYGHQTGDTVLISVAAELREQLRKVDYVARYGGEEFVCVLPETEATEATAVAERLRKAVHELVIPFDGKKIPVSMSIGVADCPSCADDKDSLIAAADSALYFAKQKGRNRVVYFREFTETDIEDSDLDKLFNRLRNANLSTIQALAMAVDARESYTYEQSSMIIRYAEKLGPMIGLNDFASNALKIASQIHDVGKIALPDRVLHKTEALTDEEKAMIKKHPEVGKQILETATEMQYLLPAIMFHHERYDGTGYPQGLKGEEIPLLARVLHIFDAYQAMMTDRPYREALTQAEAIEELKKNAGSQFDPEIIEKFVEMLLAEG